MESSAAGGNPLIARACRQAQFSSVDDTAFIFFLSHAFLTLLSFPTCKLPSIPCTPLTGKFAPGSPNKRTLPSFSVRAIARRKGKKMLPGDWVEPDVFAVCALGIGGLLIGALEIGARAGRAKRLCGRL